MKTQYELVLTEDELAVIFHALAELPLKLGLNVFIKLKNVKDAKDKVSLGE